MTTSLTDIALPPSLARFAGVDRPGVDLLIDMAHDLRSPLTSIVALSELVRSGQSGPVTDAQRHQLSVIYTAALGLSATASDFIELARGGDRLTETAPSAFSPDEVFTTVQDMVRPMMEVKALALQLEMPELGCRLGHPGALGRVLLNLATNAVKCTEEGFVRLAARELGADAVEFSVRDTGPGLDANHLDDVFQPFRAGTTSRQSFSSSGLGLSICQRLVSAMDSELHIETQPDRGTLFYFTVNLPRAA